MTELNTRQYREIETIKDDGVIAVITERVDTGHLSFRLQKEYAHKGTVKQTSYLGRQHIPAITRIVLVVEDRINILNDIAKVARARR